MIAATVRDATYLGAVVCYRFVAPGNRDDEHLLHIEVPSPQACCEAGQNVGLEVNIEDIRLFLDQS